VNFAREYRDQVFAAFLEDYRSGITPNPDVLCNREIKFGVLLDYARRLGGRRLATGHYARVNADGSLRKGADPAKDQSYFLHQVSREALADAVFPLGDLLKSDVRRLANDAGLSVYDKPDSTGICFIGERPFREFLRRFIPELPGDIEAADGRVVGAHHGLAYYTLGQRQGLGIGGVKGSGGAPWFVAGKDEARNVLIAVQGREHPALWSAGLETGPPHWIGAPPQALSDGLEFACHVKTRYRQPDVACVAVRSGERLRVRFVEPQWAVTPGQYAVIYAGDTCLGGGQITAALDEDALPAAPVADTLTAPL